MASSAKARPPIAIVTDFGYRDHYVGTMKGVIASIAPDASVIDITHGVPAQSVIAGALALREAWRFFPPGTVFLGVVDPGVGTPRLPIAIETREGARFVGPDNGLLWLAAEQAGFKRAVELKSARYRLDSESTSFHGRDIFAPAAAWIWRGVHLARFGPPLDKVARFQIPSLAIRARALRGSVVYVDGFGNLVTNIDRESLARFSASFRAVELCVRIGRGAPIMIGKAYGDTAKGAPVAIFGSFELLEIAVREGSAADRFAAREGTTVSLAPLR